MSKKPRLNWLTILAIKMKNKFKNRLIYLDKNGYPKIKLNNKSQFVHRLVWQDNFGKIPSKMTINHKDGNKLNYDISNLELMTQAENVRHAWSTGLCNPKKGEKHGRSKLDDMIVLTLLTLPKKSKNGRGCGFSNPELAKLYNISANRVYAIRSFREWRHLSHVNK